MSWITSKNFYKSKIFSILFFCFGWFAVVSVTESNAHNNKNETKKRILKWNSTLTKVEIFIIHHTLRVFFSSFFSVSILAENNSRCRKNYISRHDITDHTKRFLVANCLQSLAKNLTIKNIFFRVCFFLLLVDFDLFLLLFECKCKAN